MMRRSRLARLEEAMGTVRCPHCGCWVGPEARHKTEEEEQNSRFWEAATVEELRQICGIRNAIQARLAKGDEQPKTTEKTCITRA
jgi:hypothetical protein